MPDAAYWNNTWADLVEQLRPEDALEIIKKLIRTDNDQQLASMSAGLICGFVDRRDDKRRHYGAH